MQLGGLGRERCELSQWGPRRSPGWKRILKHFGTLETASGDTIVHAFAVWKKTTIILGPVDPQAPRIAGSAGSVVTPLVSWHLTQANVPRPNTAKQAGSRFTYPRGTSDSVDLDVGWLLCWNGLPICRHLPIQVAITWQRDNCSILYFDTDDAVRMTCCVVMSMW